jgi:CO dehydrogenase/acetyl-CoA synthase epsilon subunit
MVDEKRNGAAANAFNRCNTVVSGVVTTLICVANDPNLITGNAIDAARHGVHRTVKVIEGQGVGTGIGAP